MGWSESDTWVVVTAMLCSVACAIPGCFLVLRRMSMMGDAISHAVLPGLATAFILTGARSSISMFFGAVVTGVLTALFTQWISKYGRVDRGASMGIVFTSLFALGLILIVKAADHVDLDPGCVLYGAIELIPLDLITVFGVAIPRAIIPLAIVLVLNLVMVVALFKEFQISAFDPSLSESMGISSQWMHYALMVMVAVTTVACFESVGSIIVIAMLVVPAATAFLVTKRLISLIFVAALFGALSAFSGHWAAVFIPEYIGLSGTSTSGMIAVCSGMLFVIAWVCSLYAKKRGTTELQ